MSLFEDHLTNDVIKKLYFYTHKKIDKLQQSPIHLNIKSNDITHEVIYKTLTNKTPWDEKLCPNIFIHLAKNIKDSINEKTLLIEKNKENNEEIEFTSEELKLAFENFKLLINYLHENKEEFIKDAEKKLLSNEK